MKLRALILGGLLAAGSVAADPMTAARDAAAQLEQAHQSLDIAETARDRVRALTETVRAYEAGLTAMRDGLRQAARREAALRADLDARQAEISQIVGILQVIETAPPPVQLLHPAGPVGAARASMILAEVTPGLSAKAQALRRDLTDLQTLVALRQDGLERLEQGLFGVQKARTALSTAMADRTDLPQRFTADPIRTAVLIAATDTLAEFADGLSHLAGEEIVPIETAPLDKGGIALPVRGIVLHRAGQADAAGIRRPGIILATRGRALVTAPTAATIRYRGPLLDLGNVVILEPQADLLFVFSGLAEVFGKAGQVISAGTPVGLMGGAQAEFGAILSTSGESGGTESSETLYIEVRQSGAPVDPADWFQTDKGG